MTTPYTPPTENDIIVGIDLGTTNSCLCVWMNNNPTVLKNALGYSTTPSVVTYKRNGARLVGQQAQSIRFTTENYDNTIASVKSIIGLAPNDKNVEKANKDKLYPNLLRFEHGRALFQLPIRSQLVSPEEVSAAILKQLKDDCQQQIKGCGEVNRCVITVPEYFTNTQREATKHAARIAGWHVERIINEPSAAAFAYGIYRQQQHQQLQQKTATALQQSSQTILVYDFGGGTFDLSILCAKSGQFKVLSTDGDCRLGGDDIEHALLQHFMKELKTRYNVTVIPDNTGTVIGNNSNNNNNNSEETNKKRHPNSEKVIKCKLGQRIKEFKHSFTDGSRMSSLQIDSIAKNDNGEWVDCDISMTRVEFDQICEPFIKRTIAPLEGLFKRAKLTKDGIDTVLLVGGSTRLPLVKSELYKFFPKEKVSETINPDEAVAQGAAVAAALLSKNSQQKIPNLSISDVISLPIGVGLVDDKFSIHFEKNATIPCEFKKQYTTCRDNQTNVYLPIYEGDNMERASANSKLGDLNIAMPPNTKQGEVLMDCSFRVDENGMLNVKVFNPKNGVTVEVDLQYQSLMSPEQLQHCIEQESRLPQLEQHHKQLGQVVNKVLDAIELCERENLEIDGLTLQQRAKLEEKSQEASKWLTSVGLYDEKLTVEEFKVFINAIQQLPGFDLLDSFYTAPA